MMSNTDVGGTRTRATRRCGARITTSPSAVRASAGGWLLTKKSKVNSCRVCQIARPLAYVPASSAVSACGSNSIRGCPGGSLTGRTLLGHAWQIIQPAARPADERLTADARDGVDL